MSFLELVEMRSGMRWHEKIPDLDTSECIFHNRCMTVADGVGVLFFRSTAEGLPDGAVLSRLSAFGLQDGRPLWEEAAAAREASVVAGGVLLAVTVEPVAALIAIDPRTGVKRWTAPLDVAERDDIGTVWARDSRLLALVRHGHAKDFDLHVLDAVTGHETTRLRGRGMPCVASDAVWLEDADKHLLQRVSLADLSLRAVPLPRRFTAITPRGPCAQRGHTVWVQAGVTPEVLSNPFGVYDYPFDYSYGIPDYLFGFNADTLVPEHAIELGLPDFPGPRATGVLHWTRSLFQATRRGSYPSSSENRLECLAWTLSSRWWISTRFASQGRSAWATRAMNCDASTHRTTCSDTEVLRRSTARAVRSPGRFLKASRK